jgi:hypothetical protein
VDLPLFLGPHTTTMGGVRWDETREMAEAQSGGTTGSVREPGDGGVRVGVERVPAMSEFRCRGSASRRADVLVSSRTLDRRDQDRTRLQIFWTCSSEQPITHFMGAINKRLSTILLPGPFQTVHDYTHQNKTISMSYSSSLSNYNV